MHYIWLALAITAALQLNTWLSTLVYYLIARGPMAKRRIELEGYLKDLEKAAAAPKTVRFEIPAKSKTIYN